VKYTVDWVPTAERDLATIWVDALDQQEITDAANAIDQMLANNPLGVGESREGSDRILIEGPLAVSYDVIAADHIVAVWQVWRRS